MFFALTYDKHESDVTISHRHSNGKWKLFLDEGWRQQGNVYYKGYVLHGDIDYKVQFKNYREQAGNYIIIELEQQPKIHHSESRAFPLWYNDTEISNYIQLDNQVHYHEELFINETIHKRSLPWGIPMFEKSDPHNLDQITDEVCKHVIRYLEGIPRNLPWYAGETGGVDTALVCAAADYLGFKYKLVSKNSKSRLAHLPWGYQQMYYSHEPHYQLTGFCGDEVLARNPMYVNWMCLPYEISLDHEFAQAGVKYMTGFYEKKYRNKVQKDNTVQWGGNLIDAYKTVADHVMNDFQMWHIDHVLTVTPYRSAELLYHVMNTDIDVLIQQCIEARITMDAIKRLNSKWLDRVVHHKNGYEPA